LRNIGLRRVMKSTTVSAIGLGPMGAPIARNLLAAGVKTTVWNRTASIAVPFAELGATVAATPAEAGADIILSILPDIDQLRALLDEETLEAWGRRGARLIIMSTTSPSKVRQLGADLAPQGIAVLDAPMSGGDRGAREGSLSIMVGGLDADFELVRNVLDIIGGTVRYMGELGAGSMAKLCNQVVVAGTLTSLAEAFSLASRAGLDMDNLAEILGGGLAGSAVLNLKVHKLLEREYSLGGSAVNQLKDLGYARQCAAEIGAFAPVLELLESLFSQVVGSGQGGFDHSVIQELFLAEQQIVLDDD
jgi:3-hydroxyisobutyrate dehydrogenase-like beta-hydroxyacid dehydrogenase